MVELTVSREFFMGCISHLDNEHSTSSEPVDSVSFELKILECSFTTFNPTRNQMESVFVLITDGVLRITYNSPTTGTTFYCVCVLDLI